MTQFYTYIHCKPDLTPFYVGKGSDTHGKRSHKFTARNTHHTRIVEKYGKENIIVIINNKDSEASAFKSEIALIKMLRGAGFELCNYTDGGEGHKNPRAETRRKIGLAHRGKKISEETKKKMSIAKTGIPLPKGRHLTKEHKEKISSTRKNLKLGNQFTSGHTKTVSAETRKKLSDGMKGNKRGVGNKSILGQKRSAETLEKISKSHIARKQTQEIIGACELELVSCRVVKVWAASLPKEK